MEQIKLGLQRWEQQLPGSDRYVESALSNIPVYVEEPTGELRDIPMNVDLSESDINKMLLSLASTLDDSEEEYYKRASSEVFQSQPQDWAVSSGNLSFLQPGQAEKERLAQQVALSQLPQEW